MPCWLNGSGWGWCEMRPACVKGHICLCFPTPTVTLSPLAPGSQAYLRRVGTASRRVHRPVANAYNVYTPSGSHASTVPFDVNLEMVGKETRRPERSERSSQRDETRRDGDTVGFTKPATRPTCFDRRLPGVQTGSSQERQPPNDRDQFIKYHFFRWANDRFRADAVSTVMSLNRKPWTVKKRNALDTRIEKTSTAWPSL